MRCWRLALVLAMAWAASAADINGTWKAVFTGPLEERPKMVAEMTFELIAAGDKLTGNAHMSNWPEMLPWPRVRLRGIASPSP